MEWTCGPVQKSTQPVAGQPLARLFLDQLHLEPLARLGEVVDRFLPGHDPGLERQILRNQIPHFVFDLFEVAFDKALRPFEIVVEPVAYSRPDPEMRAGEKAAHGRGHQMRGAVSVDLEHFTGIGNLADRSVGMNHLECHFSPDPKVTVFAQLRAGYRNRLLSFIGEISGGRSETAAAMRAMRSSYTVAFPTSSGIGYGRRERI